jgi:hypothetical protein
MKLTEMEVSKVFECDCHAHGINLDSWIDTYNPKTQNGVDIKTDHIDVGFESHDYVDVSLDLWYRGTGDDYYDLIWQRLRSCWRLLRGRRSTFDNFTFRPGQIRKLGEYFITEADRLKELGFNSDGVREKK